ncbi:MAG: glycogen-binding domain-containing protein [Chitinophagaceae bacterium]|jgi:hypothetical protein|nr:glycogen-binding domain-containing protein [Chitinophagaceae bacterium]
MATKIKTMFFCSIIASTIQVATAQVAAVHFVVKAPETDTINKPVYIAGSFNYWHAGDSLYQMEKKENGLFAITLPVFEGVQYKYKYTHGNWDRVETMANDSDINNRYFVAINGKTITDTVQKWRAPKTDGAGKTPQLKQIDALKDSAAAKLQTKLNDMLTMLKAYVQNVLQPEPSKRKHRMLDKRAEKSIAKAYEKITGFLWDAFTSLTPQQRQSISAMMQKEEPKGDFVSTFLSALNTAMEQKSASK